MDSDLLARFRQSLDLPTESTVLTSFHKPPSQTSRQRKRYFPIEKRVNRPVSASASITPVSTSISIPSKESTQIPPSNSFLSSEALFKEKSYRTRHSAPVSRPESRVSSTSSSLIPPTPTPSIPLVKLNLTTLQRPQTAEVSRQRPGTEASQRSQRSVFTPSTTRISLHSQRPISNSPNRGALSQSTKWDRRTIGNTWTRDLKSHDPFEAERNTTRTLQESRSQNVKKRQKFLTNIQEKVMTLELNRRQKERQVQNKRTRQVSSAKISSTPQPSLVHDISSHVPSKSQTRVQQDTFSLRPQTDNYDDNGPTPTERTVTSLTHDDVFSSSLNSTRRSTDNQDVESSDHNQPQRSFSPPILKAIDSPSIGHHVGRESPGISPYSNRSLHRLNSPSQISRTSSSFLNSPPIFNHSPRVSPQAHQSLPHPLKFSGDHLVDAFDTKRVEVSRTQTNLPLYSFSAEHIKIKQKYDALITKWETAETSDLNLDGMRERIRTAENWDLNPDDPNRLSRQRTMTARRVARSEERPRPSTAKAYPTLFDDKSIMLRGSFRNRNSLFPGREIETQIAHAQLENVSKQQMNRTHRAQQQPEEELSIPGQTAFPGRPWTRDMPRLSMFAGGERRKDGLEQEKDSLDSSSVLELGSFVTITTPTPQPVIQPSGSANQQDSPQLNLSQSVVILEPQSTDQTEMMDVSRMETFLSQTPPQTPGNVVLSSPLKSTEESYDDYERESEPLSVKTLSLQTSPCRPAPSPNLSQDIQKEEVIEATIIPTSVDSPEEPRTPNLVTSTDPLFIPPIIFPPQILTPRPSPETSSTQHNTSDLSVAVSPTTRSPRTGSPPVHLQRPATSSQRVKTPSSIKHVHIVKRHLQSDPQSNRTTPNFSQRRSSTRELVGLNTPRSLKTDSRNYPAHILIFPQKTKRVDPLPVRNSFLLVRGGKAP